MIAPEMPKAMPTSRPVSARGSRSSSITKLDDESPWPTRVASTSRTGSVPPPTTSSSSTAPNVRPTSSSWAASTRRAMRTENAGRADRTTQWSLGISGALTAAGSGAGGRGR